MSNKQIKRTIYFYELKYNFLEENGNNKKTTLNLFEYLKSLTLIKDVARYQYFSEKRVFVQLIEENEYLGIIKCKIRAVRKDIFPELMDTLTDDVREIDAKDEEGVVETTHFIVDYSKSNIMIAIEFNQFGAKIQDLVNYLTTIGREGKILKEISAIKLSENNEKSVKERVGYLSELIVKVHKNNVSAVNSIDTNILSGISLANDQFVSEYLTVIQKFDIKDTNERGKIYEFLNSLLVKVVGKKELLTLFEVFKIRAQDLDNDSKVNAFDLLLDFVRKEIYVKKKENYKSIESNDMFSRMELLIKEVNKYEKD